MSRKFVGVNLLLVGVPATLLGALFTPLPAARPLAPIMLATGVALLVVGIVLFVQAQRRGERYFPSGEGFRRTLRAQSLLGGFFHATVIIGGVVLVAAGSGFGWAAIASGALGIVTIGTLLASARPSRRWPTPELGGGETVFWGSLAQHASARFAPAGGLTLTDRRLAFTLLSTERGYGLTDAEWPIADLASVTASETEWNGPGNVTASQLLVTLKNGRVERFSGTGVEAGEEPIRRLIDAVAD